MKKLMVLGFVCAMLLQSCGSAETVDVMTSNGYGEKQAIIAVDFYIQCPFIQAANYCIKFNTDELEFIEVKNKNPIFEKETNIDLRSNAFKAPGTVNKTGQIGIALLNLNAIDSNVISNRTLLFTALFKIKDSNSNIIRFTYGSDYPIKESALTSTYKMTYDVLNQGEILLNTSEASGATLNIPMNTKIIEQESFSDCDSISVVNAKNSMLNIIENMAFGRCTNLKKVYLPESISTIDETAFSECPKVVLASNSPYVFEFAIEHRIPIIVEEASEK